MPIVERSVLLSGTTEEVLAQCAEALARARFKEITSDPGGRTVQGRKRAVGQWTRGSLVARLGEATSAGIPVSIGTDASIQSLMSVASNPAERLADAFLRQLNPPQANPA
jgi:hypothetical protein